MITKNTKPQTTPKQSASERKLFAEIKELRAGIDRNRDGLFNFTNSLMISDTIIIWTHYQTLTQFWFFIETISEFLRVALNPNFLLYICP